MKVIYCACTLMLLSGVAVAQEQNLFNGKDLSGWDGKPGWWTVEDGALTSESTAEKKCRKANYLVWTGGEPADFELNLDFKLSPKTPKANSGVQIRSERRPDWDTFGYQADMTGNGHLVGFVYHHGRGLIAARGEKVNITTEGKRDVQKLGDSEEREGAFKAGEWNHYRIVCQGPDITLYINDVLMCKFSDHDPKLARSKGIIALQMHPGPPMKVQFKNIILKTLDVSQAEAPLIAVLKSEAGVKEKSAACRELARVGTAAAVPALAALLSNEALSHMARYGLEPIPGTEADEALRGALSKLNGESLAGLVGTIGQRRDAKAVDALTVLLASEDASVSSAAATALGRIGTAEAATNLQTALSEATRAIPNAVYDGLFECAESFSANGRKDAAVAIYDLLRAHSKTPSWIRAAAVRGAILVRGKEGLALLGETILSDDEGVALMGAGTALALKETGFRPVAGSRVRKRTGRSPGDPGRRSWRLRDARALPALLSLAKSGEGSARVAAIRAATEIGGTGVVASLMALMNDPDKAVAQTAASCLAGLRGTDVDEAVVNMLAQNDSTQQAAFAEIAAQRRILSAMPILAGLMENEEDPVRLAAIKGYGDLAGREQLPVLLAAIKTRTHADDIEALGKAIAMVCIKADDPKGCIPQLTATAETATPQATPMLLKVLKRIDGPKS